LNKVYLRRLRLVFGTELSVNNIKRALGSMGVPEHWEYQNIGVILELLNGAKENCEHWIHKQRNC
jgi:hypothetical protein